MRILSTNPIKTPCGLTLPHCVYDLQLICFYRTAGLFIFPELLSAVIFNICYFSRNFKKTKNQTRVITEGFSHTCMWVLTAAGVDLGWNMFMMCNAAAHSCIFIAYDNCKEESITKRIQMKLMWLSVFFLWDFLTMRATELSFESVRERSNGTWYWHLLWG